MHLQLCENEFAISVSDCGNIQVKVLRNCIEMYGV